MVNIVTKNVAVPMATRIQSLQECLPSITEAAEINSTEARRQGYEPDSAVCASDVPVGRPEPWMVYRNMEQTGVYPSAAVVKVGDTLLDILEGVNAGTWAVGLSRTGNEVGLNEEEVKALSQDQLCRRVAQAADRLRESGAHYVVETIADLPGVVDEIQGRLAAGDRP